MINGVKKTAAVAVVTAGIMLYTSGFNAAKPEPKVSPEAVRTLLHEATVIQALHENPRVISPTGKVSKTIVHEDDTFWGHRDFKMEVKGRYILGVATKDIEITTVGNTVKVRLPQSEIVSLELPYDKMKMIEDKSFLRKELPEKEKKALYKEAEKEIRNDIMKDDAIQANAERAMERAVAELIKLKVDEAEAVVFE
ncbi:DUF4230 domain-containing protein [Peribacillus frigoritolerans]|uniref:DUF4230 domain-containing protein n=1 Tax=Peribacillus frigoritolerans TaxID=450367 RepID=UPI002E221936|nr:DUF4230 domain-containing protein [Peribacillus frigoritolerans]MED3845555.1 DUF4230 domain-containing protein [Peribacillus frigoritolerans]